MKLSLRIRIARQRAGMSQEMLASNLGVTRSAVANWEGIDGVVPAFARLIRLAEVTRVNFEWLATGRGAMRRGGDADDTYAAHSELVYDEMECRLLRAFRRMSPAARSQTILDSEARTERDRPARDASR